MEKGALAVGIESQETLVICSLHGWEAHRGRKGVLGKKDLQSERGSQLSRTKVGHLGKGKPPRGYHSVC